MGSSRNITHGPGHRDSDHGSPTFSHLDVKQITLSDWVPGSSSVTWEGKTDHLEEPINYGMI